MMAMRRTRALFAALLIAAAASAQTSRPAPAAVEPLALVNANVVSVRDGTITANATIVLRNGRIDTVGTSAPPAFDSTLILSLSKDERFAQDHQACGRTSTRC